MHGGVQRAITKAPGNRYNQKGFVTGIELSTEKIKSRRGDVLIRMFAFTRQVLMGPLCAPVHPVRDRREKIRICCARFERTFGIRFGTGGGCGKGP
jgi:hypothetical protein